MKKQSGKHLLYTVHMFFGLLFILSSSSCVSTSTYDAQVQKTDSLQKVLQGVINEKNQVSSSNAGNLAIIADVNEEIRICKEKVRLNNKLNKPQNRVLKKSRVF